MKYVYLLLIVLFIGCEEPPTPTHKSIDQKYRVRTYMNDYGVKIYEVRGWEAGYIRMTLGGSEFIEGYLELIESFTSRAEADSLVKCLTLKAKEDSIGGIKEAL